MDLSKILHLTCSALNVEGVSSGVVDICFRVLRSHVCCRSGVGRRRETSCSAAGQIRSIAT